jgi:hypothetical protein
MGSIVEFDDHVMRAAGKDLMALWMRAHGGKDCEVHVLEGSRNLAAFVIEKAFTSAEIQLAKHMSTRALIERYARALVDIIRTEMSERIEARLEQRVIGHSIVSSVMSGNLIFLFQLDGEGAEKEDRE